MTKAVEKQKGTDFPTFKKRVEDYNVSYWAVMNQHKKLTLSTSLVGLSVFAEASAIPFFVKAAFKSSDPVVKAVAAAGAALAFALMLVGMQLFYARAKSFHRKANYLPEKWANALQGISKLASIDATVQLTEDVHFGQGIKKADAVQFLNAAATKQPELMLSKAQREYRARSERTRAQAQAHFQAEKNTPDQNECGDFYTLSL